ncbi:MAG: carbamoyl-phosphate synthase small subunit [Actinobacteria bacterium]|nr:carbamoyl-phosphate synthase small subunit [Actinomycetota bacterium]NDF68456.1 carbamoyl-phosphate synthase small subunit [Actinomycetota bacterium]NDG10944.1 carbamoyl-phosphate synthase small subunit [Actinomycetota bacterium]
MSVRPSHLLLADGSVFEGEAIGADLSVASGEVVFHTGLSGYQEVITDPSYAGQIITFTTPHIGNYGISRHDNEAGKVHARGVIIREMARRRSNWRSDEPLEVFLRERNLAGIAGIDTRRLTRVLRDSGAMIGVFGTADEATLRAALAKEKGTAGKNLVAQVTTVAPYDVKNTAGKGAKPFQVVAYDFGIKATILRCLSEIADVHVVPARTPAAEVLARKPDGVFLSNGPGDPEMVAQAPQIIGELLAADVPLFGICLGHQLLGLALGGATFKLPFGHHGANHPVRDIATGKVEITSQNHNFCVDPKSLDGKVDVTHVNLNDNTNEGMAVRGKRAFSVQYHPEAGPGPHDSRYLFARFADLMRGGA